MNYQEQLSNVFGKIKVTYEMIKKSLERQAAQDKKEETGLAPRMEKKTAATEKPQPKARAKKAVKDVPSVNSKQQKMRASGAPDSHKGSAYKGKGSLNTDAAVFNKTNRGKRDGK